MKESPALILNQYEIPKGVITKQLGDELVVVDLDSGQYYTLNPTGTMIWQNLGRFHNAAALSQFLAEQHRENIETIRGDIEELLSTLVEKNLLRRKGPS